MNTLPRREFLMLGAGALGALALGVLPSSPVAAAATLPDNLFQLKSIDEVFKALGGNVTESTEIVLTTPEIAENGAVVPVSVRSNLPGTEQILVMVEKNPAPMSAAFNIEPGTEAFVSTRVKVGQSSNIHAVVRANGKLYRTVRETKVTLGGCGG